MEYKPIECTAAELRGKNAALRDENGEIRLDNCKDKYKFSHYTAKSTVEKILSPENRQDKICFFVRRIADMNDPDEAKLHENDGGSKKAFALCFAYSRDESLPMWYLYGGITGEGADISLTPDKMAKIINGVDSVYGVHDGKADMRQRFVKGQDFDIECGWVFYRDRKERIRYGDDFYSITDDENDFLYENYFVKNYIWHYEKEFRIVFKFKTSVIPEKIAVFSDKAMLKSGLRLTYAPNVECTEDEPKADEQRYGLNKNKVGCSKIKARLELLERNIPSVVDNFDAIIKRVDDVSDLKKMQTVIQTKLKLRKNEKLPRKELAAVK